MEKTGVRYFLIASHGSLAGGMRSALELITGPAENLFVIDGYTEGNQSIEAELAGVWQRLGPEDELIVFTDLLGGSITNQVLRGLRSDRVYVVAGMNLPLLIDVLLADQQMPAADILAPAVENARAQLVDVMATLKLQQNELADD